MAFEVVLTDGSQSAQFVGTSPSSYYLMDGGLVLSPPTVKEAWGGQSPYYSGSYLVSRAFDRREIRILFGVRAQTRDGIDQALQAIYGLIHKAEQFSMTRIGSRVWLKVTLDGASPVYYEVLTGTLTLPENLMSVEQIHQKDASGYYIVKDIELLLVCAPLALSLPFNQDPPWLTISNGNGSGSEIVVNNTGTSGSNYVSINGSLVTGALPAKLIMRLKGNTGEAEMIGTIHIGAYRNPPAGFSPMLEDNAATWRISGTPQSDPESSGGTYTPISFTANDTLTTYDLAKWTVDPNISFGVFRVFGRVKHNTFWSANCNYALDVRVSGVTLLTTDWVSPLSTSVGLLDFGIVTLPPDLRMTSGLASHEIVLRAWAKAVGTYTLNLDYLMLLPILGGYRVISFRGRGLGQNEYVYDDGFRDQVYHVLTDGKRTGLAFGVMRPIELWPGVDYKIYFLMQGTSGSTQPARQLKVSMGVVGVRGL